MGDPALGVPDTSALRRRVLLTGLVAFVLFLAIGWLVAWLEVADAWLLIGMGLVYVTVMRPMLRPVREAIRLRRRLAYSAYLAEKEKEKEQGKQ
jgi:cbb3-type cytochrome oxidase subunit 3